RPFVNFNTAQSYALICGGIGEPDTRRRANWASKAATRPLLALYLDCIKPKRRNGFFRRSGILSIIGKKGAVITGITGQDGSYLAEFLLAKGYEVHGVKRRSSLFNTDRIDHLYHDPHVKGCDLTLHHGDMTDSSSLMRIVQQVQPDEIYNNA